MDFTLPVKLAQILL